MPVLWNILGIAVVAIITAIGAFAGWYAWMNRSKRPKTSGFEYVMVSEDGSAREVSEDERNYLEEEFSPADGARPYIKFRYESLDGRGSLEGFILRRQVPSSIPISCSNHEANQSIEETEQVGAGDAEEAV